MFPGDIPILPWFSHVFYSFHHLPWFSYGFPMIFTISHGFPTVFLWFSPFSPGFPMGNTFTTGAFTTQRGPPRWPMRLWELPPSRWIQHGFMVQDGAPSR